MKTQLTQQQVSSYRENGFLVVDHFLEAEELENWRNWVDNAVEQRQHRRLPYEDADAGNEETLAYTNKVFTQCLNLWMDHAGVRGIILDERIGQMAAELEGVRGIRVWHDQALIKEPWAEPTAWHQDNPKWSFSSDHSISIWVALDDVTLQNGCMFFLPGTHKHRLDKDIPTDAGVGEFFKQYPEFSEIEPVAVTMLAGSCSFHNGLMVHGAHANMSPRRRRAMTCAFMPIGEKFNGQKNILPDHYFKSLKPGDELNNDSQNPIVYGLGGRRRPRRNDN